MFQSPSLRGSGRFAWSAAPDARRSPVSIPFIAGQWSLQAEPWLPHARQVVFQSPSLRGSGRFPTTAPSLQWTGARFQSPSLRGSGRFTPDLGGDRAVSASFNPLHCGAVVASQAGRGARKAGSRFQSPSLRGSGRFWRAWVGEQRAQQEVSIPFIAGQWSLLPRTTPSSLFGVLLRKRRLPCDHIICTRLPF